MVVVLRVPGLSGFHWNLGLIVRERKIVVVIEYFQVIGLFFGSSGFLSDLSIFLMEYVMGFEHSNTPKVFMQP